MTPQQTNGGLRVMVFCSAVLHLIVFFFLLAFHFPAHFKEAPVYYVDIMDLPVANPQAGTPSQGTSSPAPDQPAPPSPREMSLPAKPPVKQPVTAPPKKPESAETAKEFEERIGRLEHEAAARHEAAALEALRKRGGARGPVGMPGAKGTEAGSDYASYIKSRLEDEFRSTIAYESKTPEVYVKLVINSFGRIVRQQIVKSSKDKLFEDSVFRTIAKAERNFRPPPSGTQFEITIKFSPQGIGKQ